MLSLRRLPVPALACLVLVACGGTVASAPPSDASVDDGVPSARDAASDTRTTSPDTMWTSGDALLTSDASPPLPDAATTAPGIVPPERPATSASGGATRWYVIKRLRIGLTTPTGQSDPSAWKQYGYDLDGRTTTATDSPTSANSCKRVAGSGTRVLTDGNLGRDNNYGQHIMAVMKSLKSDVEDAINQTITDGGSTVLLRLDNVGPDDNASVPGAIYASTGLAGGGTPTFTTADQWKLDARTVQSGQPKLAFPQGYMRGGVWVSGAIGTVKGPFPLPGIFGADPVQMESVVVSFRVSDGGDGVIAGGAPITALRTQLETQAKAYGICPGNATFDQILFTYQQSADLVSGAPQLQDTTRECDTISVGMGFVAAPASPSTIIETPPTPPDECGPP